MISNYLASLVKFTNLSVFPNLPNNNCRFAILVFISLGISFSSTASIINYMNCLASFVLWRPDYLFILSGIVRRSGDCALGYWGWDFLNLLLVVWGMPIYWELLWKAKMIQLFDLMHCNWLPSEIGHSALFGILDIGALRIDDIWIMMVQWLGMCLAFNAWGMSSLPTFGMLYMVVASCMHYLHSILHIFGLNYVLLISCFHWAIFTFILSVQCWTKHQGFWNKLLDPHFGYWIWLLLDFFFADHQQDPNLQMLL